MSTPIRRVRVRRVVLRGAAIDRHDIDQLPRLIAGALRDGPGTRIASPVRGVRDIADSVAAQVSAAGRRGGDA